MHDRTITIWRGTLIGLLTLLIGCSPPTEPDEELARPVKTAVVAAGGEPVVRLLPGTVQASTRAQLAFQVPGLLTEFPVKEGQRLSAGDLIGQLRKDEYAARLESLRAQLDQSRAGLQTLLAGERLEERLRREAQVRAAEARLENARIELNRHEQLLRSRAIPRADYDRIATAYRVATEEHAAAVQLSEKGTIAREEEIEGRRAEVRGLEARVVEAELQLRDTTLVAPCDGVVAKRFVDQNENVQAKQPVIEFQDVNVVDIGVDVPEVVMAGVRRAEIISITAELSGIPGVQFPLQISEIAQVADPVTRTFRVRLAMPVPENVQALPGMTATVTLTHRRADILGERIMVPIEAVAKSPSGDQVVWVMTAEETVEPRVVEVGTAADRRVEIRQGLQPGDRIVIAGVRFLREGMAVRDLGDALGAREP